MKKILLIFILGILSGCDTADAPDCLQRTGDIVSRDLVVEPFEELIVYGRIKLYIEQGTEHKVKVEAGKNLIDNIFVTVENNRLVLKDKISCNFIRKYNTTTVYVTVPNLTWLQNAGNNPLESIGTLNYPNIWLRSLNQEQDPEIYTNGDFKLDLVSNYIRITTDNYSNFFLTGETNYLNLYIADGDSRIEAGNLVAGTVDIQHRGTNKLIVNPQEILKGEIRSTGDVISTNQPLEVDIETFYTGKLIFSPPTPEGGE